MGTAVYASRLVCSWVSIGITLLTTAVVLDSQFAIAAGTSQNSNSEKTASSRKKVSTAKSGRRSKHVVCSAASHRKSGRKVASAHSRKSGSRHTTQLASQSSRRRAVAQAQRRQLDEDFPNLADNALVSIAAHELGTPYRFGSAGGGSFDCSGFVRTVYSGVGMDLPHSAREQFTMGEQVASGELMPGDLVFFRTYRRGASHVGIYVGDNLFIHAASRGGEVRVDSLDEAYYRSRYLGARRLREIDS